MCLAECPATTAPVGVWFPGRDNRDITERTTRDEGRLAMSRDNVYREMKQALGLVPSFFKTVPDDVLEQEWALFKRIEMGDGPIPLKYRELIGVALAGATHCRYCSLFHTEMAKLNGATEHEIEFANRVAKNSAGWSTYLNGMQVDFDEFREELIKIGKHLQSVR